MDIGIPRKFVRFTKEEKKQFAIKKKAEDEKSLVSDPDKVADGAVKYREKVARERAALGLR